MNESGPRGAHLLASSVCVCVCARACVPSSRRAPVGGTSHLSPTEPHPPPPLHPTPPPNPSTERARRGGAAADTYKLDPLTCAPCPTGGKTVGTGSDGAGSCIAGLGFQGAPGGPFSPCPIATYAGQRLDGRKDGRREGRRKGRREGRREGRRMSGEGGEEGGGGCKRRVGDRYLGGQVGREKG